jgi:hypothetical protein
MVERNNFSSITNNNCSELQKLLQAGEWEEADNETLAIMLRASKREQEGWLDLEHLKQFPDSELNIINQVWVNYSNEHFGFSVQKNIWQKSHGKNFIWEVGWFKLSSCWTNTQGRIDFQTIFDITAPQGHLPRYILRNSIRRDGSPNIYRWSWGSKSSFHLKGERTRANAFYFFNQAYEKYEKDIDCILSHQYLE